MSLKCGPLCLTMRPQGFQMVFAVRAHGLNFRPWIWGAGSGVGRSKKDTFFAGPGV